MTGDYYDDPRHWSAERYETAEERRRLQTVVSLIPATATSLLDVGCGNGAFLASLERRAALRLAGVEPSAAARDAAVCKAPLIPGSADDLPFETGSFDIVSALEVLEHIPHPSYDPARREVVRVARSHALVSVPFRERAAPTRCPSCGCRFHPHYHMRTFDDRAMLGLLRPLRLLRLRRVTVDDYVGGDLLRAGYRLLGAGSEFPRTSVCPQCGLRGDEVSLQPAAFRTKQGLGAIIRPRLPHVRRARWVVALYGR